MALQISLDVQQSAFEHDVIEGLSRPKGNRSIPSRYLYDERGCELFEEICGTPEYYPTRTEIAIMRENAHQMADLCGPRCRLVELGSGASIKTEMLLDQLQDPLVYVPVDIAPEYLRPAVEKLKRRYPDLEIEPVCADFSEHFELHSDDDVGGADADVLAPDALEAAALKGFGTRAVTVGSAEAGPVGGERGGGRQEEGGEKGNEDEGHAKR